MRGLAAAAAAVLLLLATPVVLPIAPAAAHGDEAPVGSAHGRHTIEDLALRAGLGVPFTPPDDFLAGLEHAPSGIAGATFVQAVFAEATVPSGWETAEHDSTINPEASAALISGTVDFAHVLAEDATPEAIDLGRLALTEAKALADFALVNLRNPEGRFVSTSPDGAAGEPSVTGDAAMLLALIDLELALAADGPHGDVYGDEPFRTWFAAGCDALAPVVAALAPTDTTELTLTIRALSAYGALKQGADRTAFAARVGELVAALPDDPSDAVDAARVTLALDAVATFLSDAALHQAATDIGDALADSVDLGTGLPRGRATLRAGEIADLIAAFAVVDAHDVHDAFVTRVVLESGMTPPPPPPNETLDPTDDHEVATTPPTGTAPWVMAREVTFAGTSWSVTDATIDVAGALATAVALLGVDTAPVERPPEADPESAAPTGEEPEGPEVIEVVATEFAFAPGTLTFQAGTEVTLRVNNQGVAPHNIDIPDLGVLVEVAGGAAAEITFTVPATAADGGFLCNIPGHADGGMTGTFTIEDPEPAAAPPPQTAPNPPAAPSGDTAAGSGILPPLQLGAEAPEDSHMQSAIVLAVGMFLGAMVLVAGMLRFSRVADEHR